MYEVAIVIFLLICIAMVALILVQQGKGAGMGASFGAGASNTVFGSTGSGNFLTRSTWGLIVLFFGICLFIGWWQKSNHQQASDFTDIGAGVTAEDTAVLESLSRPEDVPMLDGDVPTVDDLPPQ